VTLQDGIGRQSSVDFSAIRDTTPPTLTLEAVVQSDVLVTWNVEDSGSGVDASTCLLEVREDDGDWQTFSTECGGEDATYDGQPGHTYTFRLSASDNVGNATSLEVEAVVPYVKKYYYANGQRVAMQKEGVVYYVHTDHLGSVSLVTDHVSEAVARQLYHPYGSPRWSQGTLPTDYTFTGQRDEAGIGLMHYGARFYSPKLGRFVSADTIVPEPGEPQDLNRYTYAANNPLLYTDPTGRYEFEEDPRKPHFQIPSLPPQPSGTTWDTGLYFWIEPGGFYGEGSVYWKAGGREVGPFSVYVPPTNSQGFNDDWGFQEGWRNRGGGYIGIGTVRKQGLGPFLENLFASTAAAQSGGVPDPVTLVEKKINVDPKYIGQDQPIGVPGQYDIGGMG
jgi:RHS repeat-associated protein